MCQKCQGINTDLRQAISDTRRPGVGLAPADGLDQVRSEPHREARSRKSTRRRLWEIWHKYHCPIIGTCLEVDDLRRLARKAGARLVKDAQTDFALHVSFVAAADEKNVLSIAVQKELERRYASSVKRFAKVKSAAGLVELWQQALAEGAVPGAFWALMTHGLADVEIRTRAFEDLHMLSHQVGAGLRADLAALSKARKDLAHLRRAAESEAKQQARRLQAKSDQIDQLRQRLAQLEGIEQAYEAMRERLRELEDGRELRALRARVAEMEHANELQGRRLADAELRASALQRGLAAAETELTEVSAELREQVQAREALERLLLLGADQADGCSAPDGDSCGEGDDRAADLDLAGRRILCVGGRSDLASRYRELVGRCNGELIRHDGGLEDSPQRLEAVLARADAVICPADAVSHNAYARTKRFCKRTGKPCVLVSRSSVGAFAQALTALAAPQGRLPLQGPFSLDQGRALRARPAA